MESCKNYLKAEANLLWMGTVGFHVNTFHSPHWHTMALSKVFPSYVIPPCRAVSFVVVRHRETSPVGWWLLGGYLVSARLHCVLQVWRRILCGNSWCVLRLKTENQFLLIMDELTGLLYICSGVWPFLWIRSMWRIQAKLLLSIILLLYGIGAQFQQGMSPA